MLTLKVTNVTNTEERTKPHILLSNLLMVDVSSSFLLNIRLLVMEV